jgi:hypothetical protein
LKRGGREKKRQERRRRRGEEERRRRGGGKVDRWGGGRNQISPTKRCLYGRFKSGDS